MIEYAAAAAVGTAGSAGGKVVSNSLDRVFDKTGKLIEKTAEGPKDTPGQSKASKAAQKSFASSYSAPSRPAPSRFVRSRPGKSRNTRAVPYVTAPPEAFLRAFEAELPPAPPQAAASAEEFARITPGVTRQDLVNRIGAPSYRVRISGDGHVQEIYHYSANGASIGSVRVVDGTVSSVKIRNN
ncbi:MAG: hypothetical protein HXY18_01330 [Bryobacteraceae bacterium]|nr:hypothetical protein [Bryobacteraceae bacterium]